MNNYTTNSQSASSILKVLLVQEYLKVLGHDIHWQELMDEIDTGSSQYLLSTLSYLNNKGYTAAAFKYRWDQFDQIPVPAIFLLNKNEKPCFALLNSKSEKGVQLFFAATGYQEETFENLQASWTGLTIFVKSIPETPSDVFKSAHIGSNYPTRHIQLYDHFMSPSDCEGFIDYTEENNLYQQSLVANHHGETNISHIRTSYNANIKNRQHPILQRFLSQIARLSKVSVSDIKNFQCIRYEPGQEFKPHWDSTPSDLRKKTFILYLNEQFSGGATYFPMVNSQFTAKKGRLLAFDNVDDQNQLIVESLHAGLPIVEGTKYICVSWI